MPVKHPLFPHKICRCGIKQKEKAGLLCCRNSTTIQPLANETSPISAANHQLMIRQCVDKTIKALIRVGLGYTCDNQSIESMIKVSENFSQLLPAFFPANTTEERRLYQLLTADKDQDQTAKDPDPVELNILINRAKDLKKKVNDYLFKNPTLLKYIPKEKTQL